MIAIEKQTLLILAVLLMAAGCEAPAGSAPPGRMFGAQHSIDNPTPKELEGSKGTANGYYWEKKHFPQGATDRTSIGHGWYTFKLEGQRFLIKMDGRSFMMCPFPEE